MKKSNSKLNYFKRAFLNVIRSKAKSIILVITFFFIGNFVIVGLGVSNAAEKAKILTRQKMRAVISFEVDYNQVDKYVNGLSEEEQTQFWQSNSTNLKYSDVKQYIDDERVSTIQASSYSRNLYVEKENGIKYVPINNTAEAERQERDENDDYGYYMGDFFLKTNLFPNCIELIEGTFSIVDGEFYSQEDIDNCNDVVVITKQLADRNNLHVGDKIEFQLDPKRTIDDYINMIPQLKEEDFYFTLTVKGIYDHTNVLTPDKEGYDYLEPYENPDNLLLMPASTLQKVLARTEDVVNKYYMSMDFNQEFAYDGTEEVANVNSATEETGTVPSATVAKSDLIDSIPLSNVKIFLNDPLDVEDFVRENENNLPQFFVLNANNEEFDKLSRPLDTLNIYANLIIWLVVINAIVIITLVVALTLKTREYEIGVLLSIGASKVKIIGQFFCELAIVAILGFTLSIFSGALISQKVGNTVLEYQIQNDDLANEETYYYDSVWSDDYFTHITLDDLVSEYDSSISPLIIGEIYIMGLGIVFISTLIPAMMIMRFNPKKILMNQN